jgi:uncharacterized protein involved in type VI secretion and phage assembly
MSISRSRTTDKRYFGVYEALVTAVVDTGKEGRVKVTFPWFDDQLASEWCRVRQSYAGNGYGSFFIPEVGDEVLVAFIQGDMRFPIILGGLYNGQDKPPTSRSEQQDQKMIRTKGKHEILLDDSPKEKRVRIKTEKGHTVDLNDKEQKILVKTNSGPKVEIDDAAKKITIDTNGKSITIDGNSGTITLTGMTIVLSGSSIKLGGDSAAQSLVLGEAFMTAFNTHTHLCTAPSTPSGPPVPPLTPIVLSKISKTS